MLEIRQLHKVEEFEGYVVESNVDIPLRTATPGVPNDPLIVRANVYRPNAEERYPVLVTYGPCQYTLMSYSNLITLTASRWQGCTLCRVCSI